MQNLRPSFKVDFQAPPKNTRPILNRKAPLAAPDQRATNASYGKNALAIPSIVLLGLFAVGIVVTPSASAGSIQQPGETSGIALGPPLPQGLYFVNFLNYGERQSNPRIDTTVDIPILLWSTPWMIAGGHVLLGVSTPAVNVGVHGSSGFGDWYYPETIYGLGWQITPQLSASLIGATYYPVKNDLTKALIGDRGTNRFGGAVTYTSDGWTFSAYTQYGIPYSSDTTVPGGDHQWFNLDLTAMKAIGKWQLGIVGYGSSDTTSAYKGYKKQSQMAVGALIGYDFGPVTLQAKMTTEFSETNYSGLDTRLWSNLILPLRF